MRTLIVGAGRLGRAVGAELLHDGEDVRILDAHEEELAGLPSMFDGRTLLGSPLDRGTLAAAVAGCDALAALGPDDALNAVVALAARRELSVPLAVAVISNPARAEALAGMGVHMVCPTTRTAREVRLTLARSGIETELLLGGEMGIYRTELPARLSGRKLRELERPGRLLAVAVERDGRTRIATPEHTVAAGDVIHVAATHRDDVADLTRP